MTFTRILPFTKQLLKQTILSGDIVVDATMGNGHDTLFLAELVGADGHVLSYDIQPEALYQTRLKCQNHQLEERVSLHQKDHQLAVEDVKGFDRPLAAVMFNLGYLPGSDHHITTLATTTIQAVKNLLPHLKEGGLMTLVVYTGHVQGQEESNLLQEFVNTLDSAHFDVLRYEWVNRLNAPYLLAISKKINATA